MFATTLTRRTFTAAAAAGVFGAVAGCSGEAEEPTGPQETERVRVLTGLGFQGRESYLYLAVENGYFAEQGIEVEVLPGAGTVENLKLLAAGEVEFATLDVSGAIIEYAKRTFTDFTLISLIHQNSLACLMAKEGHGVARAADLADKTIAYIPGGIVPTLFPAYADLAGFDPETVTWVNLPPPQWGPALAADQVDAITQFVVGEANIERATDPEQVIVLPYSEYLTDLHGSGFGVATSLARDNPDLARRFNTAALRGLQDAIDDPTRAGEIFTKYQEGQPADIAAAEVTSMVPYIQPDPGIPLGAFDEARVARNIGLLQAAGALTDDAGVTPEPVEPTDLVAFDLVEPLA